MTKKTPKVNFDSFQEREKLHEKAKKLLWRVTEVTEEHLFEAKRLKAQRIRGKITVLYT